MGPRRMDGAPRPQAAGGRPVQGAPVRPQMSPRPQGQRPMPVQQQRPMAAPARPMRPAPQQQYQPASQQQRPMRQQALQPEYAPREQQAPARTKKRGGGWKVVLQFVVGLAVIAAVAAAIVWLYIKYYQQ